jgi:N6-adenosine-specific RNA methylase IME4/ParB-like chromosome segregation protein Spo0J
MSAPRKPARRACPISERDLPLASITVPRNRLRALRPETVDELTESIRARGLLQAIVVRPGSPGYVLSAGRHRLEAHRKLGLASIRAVVREGLDADQAELIEIDENLIRADLSPIERDLHHARRKQLYERAHPETKRGGDRRSKSHGATLKSPAFINDTARKTGAHRATVARSVARGTALNEIPNAADAIGTSLDQPIEVEALRKLPAASQQLLIQRAKAGAKVSAKVEFKKLRRAERERELAAATEAASETLGAKVYGLLYADCPWRYNNPPVGDEARANEQHYPTMEVDDLCALTVPAAEDCVLFLWATIPTLPAALKVMAAWGFTYKSAITWVKDREGTGYWVRGQVELLLIGTRGNVPAPAPGERPPAVIDAARGAHSEKPAVFRDEIARLFPNVPKLEMFARGGPIKGWDRWGNEAYDAAADTVPERQAGGAHLQQHSK